MKQADRQTVEEEKQRNKQTGRQTDSREREIERNRQTNRQTVQKECTVCACESTINNGSPINP